MDRKMVVIVNNDEPDPRTVLLTPDQIRLMEWLRKQEYLYCEVTFSVQDGKIESI